MLKDLFGSVLATLKEWVHMQPEFENQSTCFPLSPLLVMLSIQQTSTLGKNFSFRFNLFSLSQVLERLDGMISCTDVCAQWKSFCCQSSATTGVLLQTCFAFGCVPPIYILFFVFHELLHITRFW